MAHDECSCLTFINFRIHYSLSVTFLSPGLRLFLFSHSISLLLINKAKAKQKTYSEHVTVLVQKLGANVVDFVFKALFQSSRSLGYVGESREPLWS